jgi:hypothetical protein
VRRTRGPLAGRARHWGRTAKKAKSVLPHLAQSQDQRKTTSALEPCAQLEFQSTVGPHLGKEVNAAVLGPLQCDALRLLGTGSCRPEL